MNAEIVSFPTNGLTAEQRQRLARLAQEWREQAERSARELEAFITAPQISAVDMLYIRALLGDSSAFLEYAKGMKK
jgi:hypothetical protein